MSTIWYYGDQKVLGNYVQNQNFTSGGVFYASNITTLGVSAYIGAPGGPWFTSANVVTSNLQTANLTSFFPNMSLNGYKYGANTSNTSFLGNFYVSNSLTASLLAASLLNTSILSVQSLFPGKFSLGTSNPSGTMLYIQGNAYVSNALLSTTLVSTMNASVSNIVTIVAGTIGGGSSNLYVQGNVYVSNALTATNVSVATMNSGFLNTTSIVFPSNAWIGTDVPSASNLFVQGNVYVSNALTARNVFVATLNAGFLNSTTIVFGSNVGIGTTSPQGANLFVQGNVFVAGLLTTPNLQYSVEDLTLRSPHLIPNSINGPLIQAWISGTCNAALTSFWSKSASPAYSNVVYGTGYSGGVFLPDGTVLFVPSGSSSIGVYNPKTQLASQVVPSGAAITDSFNGGVLLPNGNVLFVPQTSNIGMYNPVNFNYSVVASLPTGSYSGVLTSNGVIFAPQGTPSNVMNFTGGSLSNILALPLASGGGAQQGACLLPSGNVLVPSPGTANVIQFDPVGLGSSNIVVGTSGFSGLVLAPNGNVIGVPLTSNILVINPNLGTSSNVRISGSFSGGCLLPSGNVVFAPSSTSNVGMFDPVTLTYSNSSGAQGFSGATLVPNGQVILTPSTSANVGVLDTQTPVQSAFCLSPYFNKF